MKQSNNKVSLVLALISNGLLVGIFVANFFQLLRIHERVQQQLTLPVIGNDPSAVIANLKATDVSIWQWLINGAVIAVS